MDDENEVLKAIIRLESKMDVANGRLEDHGKRLRALEAFRNMAAGAGAIIGLAWAAIKVNISVKQ